MELKSGLSGHSLKTGGLDNPLFRHKKFGVLNTIEQYRPNLLIILSCDVEWVLDLHQL